MISQQQHLQLNIPLHGFQRTILPVGNEKKGGKKKKKKKGQRREGALEQHLLGAETLSVDAYSSNSGNATHQPSVSSIGQDLISKG